MLGYSKLYDSDDGGGIVVRTEIQREAQGIPTAAKLRRHLGDPAEVGDGALVVLVTIAVPAQLVNGIEVLRVALDGILQQWTGGVDLAAATQEPGVEDARPDRIWEVGAPARKSVLDGSPHVGLLVVAAG